MAKENELRHQAKDYTSEQFNELVSIETQGITEIPLLILKCHILVEWAMTYYLGTRSNEPKDFFEDKLHFNTKMKMVKYFGGMYKSPAHKENNYNKALLLMNDLRNSVAHDLRYDEKILGELLAELEKKDAEIYKDIPKGDKGRRLVKAAGFIAGAFFRTHKVLEDIRPPNGRPWSIGKY